MDDSLKYLIQKFVAGECTPEEVARLVAYFENAELDAGFPKVEEILSALEEMPELSDKDADKIYDQIRKKIKTKENAMSLDAKKKRRYKKYGLIAALFIGILGGITYFKLANQNPSPENVISNNNGEDAIRLETGDGDVQLISTESHLKLTNKRGAVIGVQNDSLLTYQPPQESSGVIEYNTLQVPYGKRFQIQLADGSRVYMNAGSSLKYPVNFPKEGEREVFLTGEAYFDVAKDEEHPFIVNAKQMGVEVLGTEFNVSAYPEDQSSRVVLVNGSVNLSSGVEEVEERKISPGELAEYNPTEKGFEVKEVDTKLYTAWMEGGLVFRDERFENILKKMERHYNVTIINKNKELAKEKFNASFGPEPIDKLLDYFQTVYGLKYVRSGKDTLVIQQKEKK